MWRLINICGGLWLMYGFTFLAFSTSIKSLPERFTGGEVILMLYAIISIVCGIFFFLTGFGKKKKLIFHKLYKSLFRLLIHNNFKISLFEFAKENKIGTRQAQYFISKTIDRMKDRLMINQKGLIEFR